MGEMLWRIRAQGKVKSEDERVRFKPILLLDIHLGTQSYQLLSTRRSVQPGLAGD